MTEFALEAFVSLFVKEASFNLTVKAELSEHIPAFSSSALTSFQQF